MPMPTFLCGSQNKFKAKKQALESEVIIVSKGRQRNLPQSPSRTFLLSTYYVPNTVLGPWGSALNVTRHLTSGIL